MFTHERSNKKFQRRAAACRDSGVNGVLELEDKRTDLVGGTIYGKLNSRPKSIKPLGRNSESIQLRKKIHVDEPGEQLLADTQHTSGKKYVWQCSFYIYLPEKDNEPQIVQCVIYISTKASDKVVNVWQEQINKAWGKKFAVRTGSGKQLPITVQIHKDKKKANYKIENVSASKAIGKRGLFGTESMTKWGENDPQDIPHEVGHMLGNKDEYGMVWEPSEQRWFDYGYASQKGKDERDEGEGNIMMRGDLPVRKRHFDLIFKKVQESGYLGENLKLVKYFKR